MDGRLQNELSIEKKNDAKVKFMPTYVEKWYLNMKASRKTASTCHNYLNIIHKYLESINKNVISVKLSDINERSVLDYFVSAQTKLVKGEIKYTSDSYQIMVWSCLDNFLGYLHKAGLIDQNYIRNVNKPKNRDLDRINEHRVLLTESDFRRIISAVERESNPILRKRNMAIMLLFMNTGIRKTALTCITLDNLDLKNKKLHIIDKGNKRHEYILNDRMINVINDWLSVRWYTTDNHLFISSQGRGLSSLTVANVVKKYTEDGIGYGVSPHKLRSGYCSILYNQTGDIEFVRRCVGHSNSDTTKRYIVTKGAEKEKAAEIMAELF